MVSAQQQGASVSAASVVAPEIPKVRPDANGRYGKFGGKYVPETLIAALTELEEEFKVAIKDPKFQVRVTPTGNPIQ